MPAAQAKSEHLAGHVRRPRANAAGMDDRSRQAMRRRNLRAGEELGGIAAPTNSSAVSLLCTAGSTCSADQRAVLSSRKLLKQHIFYPVPAGRHNLFSKIRRAN